MIVTINRPPAWADALVLPVGAVISLPASLADPLIAAGEAVPTPSAVVTQRNPFGVDSPTGVFRGPYTWAARPLTGLTVGDTFRATDVGLAPGTMMVWTGSSWRRMFPFTLAEFAGSVASPVASLGTGITAGTFALPSVPTLPAGMLAAGDAVMFDYLVTQAAAFTTDINLHFGTAGTTSDSQVGSRTLTAAANRTAHSRTEVSFYSATLFVPAANVPTNDQTTATLNDRTTNVNLDAPMLATLGVANGNTANSWKLIWFRLLVL